MLRSEMHQLHHKRTLKICTENTIIKTLSIIILANISERNNLNRPLQMDCWKWCSRWHLSQRQRIQKRHHWEVEEHSWASGLGAARDPPWVPLQDVQELSSYPGVGRAQDHHLVQSSWCPETRAARPVQGESARRQTQGTAERVTTAALQRIVKTVWADQDGSLWLWSWSGRYEGNIYG